MKIIAWLIFILSLLQVVLGVGKLLFQRELIDFAVYYEAAKASLDGLNPYSQTYGDFIAYNYPPSALIYFWPFSALLLFNAQLLFTLLSLAALFLTGYLLTQKLPQKYRTTLRLLIFSLLLQNFPTKFTLVMGQVNMFVLLFLVLSFVADQKKKFVLSGIFYAFASMIKLTPLTFGLYFLVRGRLKSLIVGLGLFIVVNLIMLRLWQGTDVFFSDILPLLIAQPGTQASLYDQSIRAFLARIGLGDSSLVLSGLITLSLFGFAIYRYVSSKSSNKDFVFFSLILAITTIGSSYTWQHHLVFLFPGYIAITVALLKNAGSLIYDLKSEARNPKHETNSNDQNSNVLNTWIIRVLKIVPPQRDPANSAVISNFDIRISSLRILLLLLSALLVGYHFPDIAYPPTSNPILMSHSLFGSLILIGLLLWTT